MRIGVLTSYFFQEITELSGKDRIIFGGAEKYLYELCRFLQSEGHKLTVYQPITIPKDIDSKTIPAQIQKEYKGIPIICLPHLNNWTPMGTNPELNQFFNEAANYYDIAVFFVTFLAYPNVPKNSISISHGIYWDHPYSSYALASGEGKQEYLRQHLYGFEAPAVCVAVDSNVKRVIQAIKPGAESNIRVIANFVDCEKFKPVEKTWEGIRVLYPRRLSILRGQNEFIRATQLHPEYQYLAVGQATREDTEKKAADWAKTLPHLKFIHKEMDGMEEVYQQSDIAVVPTKACEGLSLSLLESMACGLPIITTHVGGICDAVIDGYNALVFDPESNSLAEYIHYLAENKELRRSLGDRNREIAKCFDIKIWQERWRGLLAQFGITRQEQKLQIRQNQVAGKTTIAYPPELRWDVMQQRPHHFLKLAAKDGLHVYFGDNSVSQSYEPVQNLTVISPTDWQYIEEVDVLYITRHAQLEKCRNIKYAKLIYDCCDWRDGDDTNIILKADYVLCASKMLYDKVSKMRNGKDVIYLPNACEFEHFAKISNSTSGDMAGYMGVFHSAVIDIDLFNALAEKVKLKIIGPFVDIQASGKNISAVGHVDYDNLPKALSDCKVGILPFRTDSDWTMHADPIKIYEYLAAGLPVVATPIPELLPLADMGLIHVVQNDDFEGWIEAIEKAMSEYPNTKGQEWAKKQAWESRWSKVKDVFLNNV